MGEGWETRRRREPGNDHALFRLAMRGAIRLVEVDTSHFRYNASVEVALFAANGDTLSGGQRSRRLAPLFSRRRLQPDTRHCFPVTATACACVRLDAFPDGGISRVRL